MPPIAQARNSSPLNLIVPVLLVASLYFTRSVCVPFILAVLLTFVLSPVVSRLRQWHIPRVPAVFLLLGFLLCTLALCGWLVGGQLVSLAEKLPQYQANVHQKFKSFRTAPGGVIDRLNSTLDSYLREFESVGSDAPLSDIAAAPATSQPAPSATAPAPIVVSIVKTQSSKVVAIEDLLLSVAGPLTTCGIITVLSLLMLIRQEDVRDRAIRLISGGRLQIATQALDDAGQRVSRYLIAQLIINASFGIAITIGLFLIGVPYSLLWGLLAGLARFIPFFGAPVSAIGPLAMAFAAIPGWWAVLFTIILFAALELGISNFIEPALYGSNTRISPLAIVVSAIFWSWLWGPVGLFLSTPLTVCLVVIGWHVPRLRFLSVILGDEPALAPDARFYQRLLASDQAEAWEIAEEKLRDSSLADLYDTLIIPALILAEEDRHHDLLDESHEKYIFQGVRELLADLAQRPLAATLPPPAAATDPSAATARAPIGAEPDAALPTLSQSPISAQFPKVLCLPASDEADEMAALMLSHLLAQRGIQAEVLSFKTLAGERLKVVEDQPHALVCVSAVPPEATLHARHLCKRLRAGFPDLQIVAGMWQSRAPAGAPQRENPLIPATSIATTLAAARDQIVALAHHEAFRSGAIERPAPSRTNPILVPAPRESSVSLQPLRS